jgi:glycosyltransferase involved in cell wall biosynthesis
LSQAGGRALNASATEPRTVLVLPAWYPTSEQPLAGVFVRDHARAAAAYGHRLVVLVNEENRSAPRGLFSLVDDRDGPLRIARLSYRRSLGTAAFIPAVAALSRRLAREGTPVDLLHAHVHWMGWAATQAGWLMRRPVVISEHSSEWPRGQITPAALRRARIAFRRAALVCPVDAQLERAIEERGVHGRFRVVPNTVDTGVFRPPSRAPGTHARLVNVAQHVEVKAHDVLLEAFAGVAKRRPGLTLVLIGEGPLTPKLKQLAVQLAIEGAVSFVGSVDAPRVAEELRRADALVMSSLSENLPLALLEALCCGLPVAATSVGGIPNALGTDGELAPPGDPERLASAVEAVLGGYSRFDRDDIAARAAARWSFATVGAIWDEIYRSL